MPDVSTVCPRSTTDYDRIAVAIASFRSSPHSPVDAATLAHAANLSEADWQALVRRWAGVSAEQFVRSLTLEATQARLTASRTRFNATSGGPRGQSPPVQLTAWPPAAADDAQSPRAIAYGWHDTRFGLAGIAATEQELCMWQFGNAQEAPALLNKLQKQWPRAVLYHAPECTKPFSDRLHQVGSPTATPQPLALLVQGTPFQIQVWRALLTLPLGSLATYQDLAHRLGNPKAARAVGTAIGANPIAYWLPCHRIIRASGDIGGYRWGPGRKAAMLGWEAGQRPEGDSWLPAK